MFEVPRSLTLALEEEGVALPEVLRAAGLRSDMPEQGRCLSWEQLVALVAAAVRVVGDESFAARAGAAVRPESFGVVGLLAMSAETFGQALHGLARYKRLLANQRLTIEITGARAVVGLPFLERGPAGVHHLVESECAFIVHFGRWTTKRPVVPLAIHVRHAQSRGTEALAAITGAPVRCARARDELILPAEVLGYELVSANPQAVLALGRVAEDELALAVPEITVAARVQAALRQRRGGRTPAMAGISGGISEVARALGMSVRSLQRHLRDEGTSFQEVLDETRKEMALGELREARLDAEALAFVLGFSHINSFYRAFRRWTGMTPIEYSRQRSPGADGLASLARS
jgi:AraC-like DNA-binding protein